MRKWATLNFATLLPFSINIHWIDDVAFIYGPRSFSLYLATDDGLEQSEICLVN